ncbi:MAG: hypothetical protein IT335_00975 [Thermomicrobiales bacterium]|nr:hypothetical protein [Thermomicrobiales bacterium]
MLSSRMRRFMIVAFTALLVIQLVSGIPVRAQDSATPVAEEIATEVVVDPAEALQPIEQETADSTPESVAEPNEGPATPDANEPVETPASGDDEVELANGEPVFRFVSVDCLTGEFTMEITHPNPDAPADHYVTVTVEVRSVATGSLRDVRTLYNIIIYQTPGVFTRSFPSLPAEGGVSEIRLSASDFGEDPTISCQTPDHPIVRLTSVDCTTGELTFSSTGAINKVAYVTAQWTEPSNDYTLTNVYGILGPGTYDVDFGTTLDDHPAFVVTLAINYFRADSFECSEETPTYTVFEPAGPNPQVTFNYLYGYVGAVINYQVSDFPPNAPLQVVLGTMPGDDLIVPTNATTDASGIASGSFTIPAVHGSATHNFRIAVGFELMPGLGSTEFFSLSPGAFNLMTMFNLPTGKVQPGQLISGEITGAPLPGPNPPVRFYHGESFVEIGSIDLIDDSIGTFSFEVPMDAAYGGHRIDIGTGVGFLDVYFKIPPMVELFTTRTTVNNSVGFALAGFAKNRPLTVTWKRPGGSTVVVYNGQTSPYGEAVGYFKVPATEGGPANRIIFTASSVTRTVAFDVAPRIKLIPGSGTRGGTVEVSLRGFTKGEAVRIRWKIGSSFVLLTTVTLSNTGSGNYIVTIPSNAPIGPNSVRADGTVWRQQTNAFVVSG